MKLSSLPPPNCPAAFKERPKGFETLATIKQIQTTQKDSKSAQRALKQLLKEVNRDEIIAFKEHPKGFETSAVSIPSALRADSKSAQRALKLRLYSCKSSPFLFKERPKGFETVVFLQISQELFHSKSAQRALKLFV